MEIPTEQQPDLSQADVAFSRLEEFPGDPVQTAKDITKEDRMKEMEQWADSMGAHVARLELAHHTVAKQEITAARKAGKVTDARAERIRKRLARVNEDWRTGIIVHSSGNVSVHDRYPYSTDTPAGELKKYRSPKNIRQK